MRRWFDETGVYHDCYYNGELITFPVSPSCSYVSQDEMALPGSDLYPSRKMPVGAICVLSGDNEMRVVGCFWRYQDLLVTALHVASAVNAGVADVYLVGLKVGAKGICRLDETTAEFVDPSIFNPDDNLNFHTELDLFAVRLSPALWSKIKGVEKATVARSKYGQVITAVGFSSNTMMTSAGKTLQGSGIVELWHTASTNKGFSGAPVFAGRLS